MATAPYILASGSPQRATLLQSLPFAFEIIPCPLREPHQKPRDTNFREWAMGVAYFKARYVAARNPGRWILGADTIVVSDGVLFGKPTGIVDARRMLEHQAGRATQVITGVVLVRCPYEPGQTRRYLFATTTTVTMRDDLAAHEQYLASGDWAGKAGAYGIQTPAANDLLVESIEGSFTNVIGLPMEQVEPLLCQVLSEENICRAG
ncbi:MAG: nucleoside triphosphate pyrophosphatase [Phycisphaerae bacterium]